MRERARDVEQRRAAAGGLVAVLAAATGVALYLASPGHSRHDPQHHLQQVDLLYLDEPAPGLAQVGFRTGSPAILVFCPGDCPLPELEGAQVLRSGDVALARQYALGAGGRTGFALVDGDGDVRYRSYDPAPHQHEPELQTLVDALVDR
jgi:hypothetical protein